ncbi:uncharacterized protein LOC109613273 isoform X2 [Musca domestica]|uniref:Uncharacterized protein LOC109613273 isoform X2 n=1 Tax=Musca domestica TaxID=7370 RepID=A0A9J7DKA3_MUSDO|nr:uncharacterized protein LOC109613273 isoform X2 [Musca domestica]
MNRMNSHNRKENAWERLSRARNSPSSENLSRSRTNLRSKPSQRFQLMKQMAANHQQQQQQLMYQHQKQPQEFLVQRESPRRPLTPNSNRVGGVNPRGSKCRLPKPTVMPEMDNRGYFYNNKPTKMIKDLMNARSLINSKSSVMVHDNRMCVGQSAIPISRRSSTNLPTPPSYAARMESASVYKEDYESEDGGEEEEEEYKLAPLMSSRSHLNLQKSSRHILRHFHEAIQERGRGDMKPEELELDILRDQLKDILKHEHVVKEALSKLESKENLHEDSELKNREQPLASNTCPEEPKKLEVDVVFKNVPSLEREILILRALGEKLQSTLHRTNSQRNILKYQEIKDTRHDMILTSRFKAPIILQIKTQAYVRGPENEATILIKPQGIMNIIGIALEFCIAHKSIVELKTESSQPFLVELDAKTPEMKETSFMELKENPNMLIKYIKSKNPEITFNILDHDPIFFNNILSSNKPRNSSLKDNDQKKSKSAIKDEVNNISENSSQNFVAITPGKLSKETEQRKADTKLNPVQLNAKQSRRRIRKFVTPLPVDKPDPSPKNHLFKTILVGVVQISCFILLIMAFTFPDAKC